MAQGLESARQTEGVPLWIESGNQARIFTTAQPDRGNMAVSYQPDARTVVHFHG